MFHLWKCVSLLHVFAFLSHVVVACNPRTYLVMTNNLQAEHVPGNIRALNMSQFLVSYQAATDDDSEVAHQCKNRVMLVAKSGDLPSTMRTACRAAGISLHSLKSEDPEFMEQIMNSELNPSAAVDVAFLYLWFWAEDASVPEVMLKELAFHSPSTTIVIVTDDVHHERARQLVALQKTLTRPSPFPNKIVTPSRLTAAFESSLYQQADAVVAVTEKDENSIRGLLSSTDASSEAAAPSVHTVHMTETVALPPMSAVALRDRSGFVFVGSADSNPSNWLGVEWFVEHVLPNLESRFSGGGAFIPFYIVGGTAKACRQMQLTAGATTNVRMICMPHMSAEALGEVLMRARVLRNPASSPCAPF